MFPPWHVAQHSTATAVFGAFKAVNNVNIQGISAPLTSSIFRPVLKLFRLLIEDVSAVSCLTPGVALAVI
jgi:hypothetical protein